MSSPSAERKMSAPLINPEAQPWFDATAQGKLLYRHCTACGVAHHPPRSLCPHCRSDQTIWKESAGLGQVFSASLLRRGTPVPYCIAYVQLDEGVALMTNVVGFGDATPPVGTRVRVRFVEADGGAKMPVFEPLELR